MDALERNEVVEQYQNRAKINNCVTTVFVISSNREKYVGKAIKSILEQTYKNFCLVILDNYSKDKTIEIVKEFNDDRLFLIEHESPFPLSNYKYAFSICTTKYLTVFHDDDIVDKDYLSIMLDNIQKDESIVLMSASANIINSNDEILSMPHSSSKTYANDEYFRKLLMVNTILPSVCFPTNMYKASFYSEDIFEKCDDAGPAVDQYITLQTERFGGKVRVLADRLINYRVHDNQASRLYDGIMALQLFDFLYKNPYYHDKIYKYRYAAHRFFVATYKSLIKNYKNNHNIEIRKHFKINKEYFKFADIKTRICFVVYGLSYCLFYFTVVPCAYILRLREKNSSTKH